MYLEAEGDWFRRRPRACELQKTLKFDRNAARALRAGKKRARY